MKAKPAPSRLQQAIAAVVLGSITAPALATDIDELLIIGSRDAARSIAGSGAVVDADQIRTEAATDINQLLKTVPGIYVREEDGLGLRPNIGIRGATSERSNNITLMEDGVLMAPAPYSAPAAYYFPTTLRQSGVEVLKGAPLLRHGPQTTGGVVNMVSTPIPQESAGRVQIVADERGGADLHGWYGNRSGQWGWMLETVQRDGAGFKKIDGANDRGDYSVEDYVGKLGWQSARGREQSLLLKVQYSEESSEETYLGLTDTDFARTPNRRYGMSSIDEMSNRHASVHLNYRVAVTERITASSNVYQHDFSRNWFKLSGGSNFVNAANNGDAGAQAILDGQQDVSGLSYKHNDRSYVSRGIDLNIAMDFDAHQLDVGLRLHEDDVDRFQPVEVYDQVNGQLQFSHIVTPGSGDNRLGESEAVSFWLMDTWQASDALSITAALRYEDVESTEMRYGNTKRSQVVRTDRNQTREWLPGLSMTYELSEDLQLLAGVHRGFSPLGAGAAHNENPETSTNWEAGLRYNTAGWFLEGIGFYSDFSNKAEHCSIGTPCSDGSTIGSFTTGEARIAGLELQASTVFHQGASLIPLDISYTWTDAEITRTNPVIGVNKGDLLKDIPEHIYSVRSGIEHSSGWNNYVVAKYMDRQCVNIGCNRSTSAFAETDSLFVVDFISRYTVREGLDVFLKLENVLDEHKIVSRDPDGARPNKPRTASLGLAYSF